MTKQKITVELPDEIKVTATLPAMILTIDTPEAADELIERVKAAKAKRPVGMPDDGQVFWYITENGYADSEAFNTVRHRDLWELGNTFLTEAECLREIDRRKALQRVKAWKQENGFPEVKYESLFDLPIMQGLTTADQLLLIESCEADLRTLAGVE